MLAGHGLGLALIRDGNGARAFDTLLRYRGGTLAELWRALRTLKALQAEQAVQVREVAPEPAAPPEPPLLAEPREMPIEPDSRAKPGDIALPRAASEPAPPPAASVPAVLPCNRAAAPTRLPDEPERRANPGNSARSDDRAVPKCSEARQAEPALSLPIELPQGSAAAALLAGTALVPLARRSLP